MATSDPRTTSSLLASALRCSDLSRAKKSAPSQLYDGLRSIALEAGAAGAAPLLTQSKWEPLHDGVFTIELDIDERLERLQAFLAEVDRKFEESSQHNFTMRDDGCGSRSPSRCRSPARSRSARRSRSESRSRSPGRPDRFKKAPNWVSWSDTQQACNAERAAEMGSDDSVCRTAALGMISPRRYSTQPSATVTSSNVGNAARGALATRLETLLGLSPTVVCKLADQIAQLTLPWNSKTRMQDSGEARLSIVGTNPTQHSSDAFIRLLSKIPHGPQRSAREMLEAARSKKRH